MRAVVVLCVCCAIAGWAQQRKAEYRASTFDADGNRLSSRTYTEVERPGKSARVEMIPTLNGTAAPWERVEERVIEDGPRGRVVERIVQPFSQDGVPGTPQKIRIEERRDAAGVVTTVTSRFDGDLNGRFQLRERSTKRSEQSGNVTSSTIVVEQPDVNGSLALAERRVEKETARDTGSTKEITVYRPEQGQLVPAAREVTETTRTDSRETSTITRYNTAAAMDGRMALAGQIVADVERRPDGSERRVISEYGGALPGRSITNGNGIEPHLREQLIVERQVRSDGGYVERSGVRRVSLSDPNRLEPYQPVSEVVCQGDCLPPKPAAKEEQNP